MSELFEELNKLSIEELESLLESPDHFSYHCERKILLALIIKVIKQKKSEFIKSRVL